MTISGTDFYDPASSGAKCPVSNRIRLNNGGTGHNYEQESSSAGDADPADNFIRSDQTNCLNGIYAGVDLGLETTFDPFCYFATNGAYSTANDGARRDVEGYVGIPYETGDEELRAPIISSDSGDTIDIGLMDWFAGNVLTPGDEIAITFRLTLPEPCNGDFSDGQLFFWGTAI